MSYIRCVLDEVNLAFGGNILGRDRSFLPLESGSPILAVPVNKTITLTNSSAHNIH